MKAKLLIIILIIICITWQVQAAVNCTKTGPGRFPDPSDTKCKNYTLCVATSSGVIGYNYICPSTALYNPNTSRCTTNYVCKPNKTSSTDDSTFKCTAEGFYPDPSSTDCSSYIGCINLGTSFESTSYTCPPGTLFDPDTTFCEPDYVCPAASFKCSSVGRFANTTDTTCKTYHYCVLATNGTLIRYDYTCPSVSVFNPRINMCTTSYACC